jgi:triosephosphate isomerase
MEEIRMRRPYISGNWKMNLNRDGVLELCSSIRQVATSVPNVEIGVFPPYPYLPLVVEAFKDTQITVGGQDLYFEKKGAFTGEVSGAMIKDVGAASVLVGHSERRHLFGDTDEDCRKKMRAALDAGLKPVLCLGEQLPEREAGRTAEVVIKQAEEGTRGFSEEELKDMVIAYEPVWAIGTGVNATPDQAEEAHQMIRNWFQSAFSTAFADGLRILYGGSVSPDNVDSLMAGANVDGALVGGASLKAESFCRIICFNQN